MIERLALCALLLSCQSKSDVAPSANERTSPGHSAAAAPARATAVTSGAQQELDRIDKRTPVPLLPMMANHQKQNMRDHLLAVQQIVAAVAKDDFASVERAAQRLGFTQQMGQMCEHMGSGAPGFTDVALRFHHDADKIGEAARKRDSRRVLTLLGETLSQCTACHETYKQSIVDSTEWASVAGKPAAQRHVD